MASAIQSIQGAGEELTEIQSEVLRLEQRVQSVRRTLREAIGGISILETQPSPAPRATPTVRYQLRGHPLKTDKSWSRRRSWSLLAR
jgi:hypothetical protein